jgi:hypothetical protein
MEAEMHSAQSDCSATPRHRYSHSCIVARMLGDRQPFRTPESHYLPRWYLALPVR